MQHSDRIMHSSCVSLREFGICGRSTKSTSPFFSMINCAGLISMCLLLLATSEWLTSPLARSVHFFGEVSWTAC